MQKTFPFKVANSDLKGERSNPQSIHFRPIYQPFPVFIQFYSKSYHFNSVGSYIVLASLPRLGSQVYIRTHLHV